MTIPFLPRNLPQEKRQEYRYYRELQNTKNELEFYKSIFKTHWNSAVFNLRIKMINDKKIWVDRIKITTDYELLYKLNKDDEVIEWLKPVRCER